MLYDLARNWWLLVLNGVLAVLFGVAAVLWPGITFAVLVLLFGAFAFAQGVLTLSFGLVAAGDAENWWALVLSGILGVVVGVLTFARTAEMALALVYVIGMWATITGLLGIVAAIRLRKFVTDDWLLGFAGVLSIIFGALVLFQPVAGALAVTYMFGLYGVLLGVTQIVFGIRAHGLVAAVNRRVHAASVSN